MKLLRSSKAISKKVNPRIITLYRSQALLMRDHYLKKLILILNFINFIALVSNSFNIKKIKYCIKNIYQFYLHIFHKFVPFITQKKMFYSELQFEFLKLRHFLVHSLTEDHRITKTKMLRKNCWPPRQMLAPKCSLPPTRGADLGGRRTL